MAAPLLAPLASLLPVIKILALGSLKFVGVGIGAAVAPVKTANFLVGMSAGTPLKYAQFRQQNGYFSVADLELIERANSLIAGSIKNTDEHMSREDARAFLKNVLISTFVGMKESVMSIPSRIVRMTRLGIDWCKNTFSSRGK